MKETAIDIFQAALQAVDPYVAVHQHMDRVVSLYRDGAYTRLYVIGIGKAAFPMMRAVVDDVGARVTKGIVLTKYGHAEQGVLPGYIDVLEAGHPVPDEKGLAATRKIIDTLDMADDRTLVLCLISGGASALLVAPHEKISLAEKQQVTQYLLKAGADIFELNTVRKHISRAKGGRLAEHAFPARVMSLILSDVIGDPLDVIASGPTAPDASTYEDAMRVIRKYGLEDRIPKSVLSVLTEGLAGNIPETPKRDHPAFTRVENIVIGSNRKATEAAQLRAQQMGYESTILGCDFQGEASDVGKFFAKKTLEVRHEITGKKDRKICLIAGGETTVKVSGNGIGGRSMEMALVVAKEIAGSKGILFLSAGTDGTDGPTDAAGAIVDGKTLSEARDAGLDSDIFLRNNDSYNFFKPIHGLIMTGPTGTNVMDIHIMLIEDRVE
ncbi:MAG TPA: glycerate kinase [Nitrospirota bacterium]|nr:glycerate kinase [Nitrospirota bacterium]